MMKQLTMLLLCSLLYQTAMWAQHTQLLTDRLFFNNGQGTTANLQLFGNGTLALTNLAAERLSLATNNITRLTILGDGNVGIGVSVPAARLHVNNSTTPAVLIGQENGVLSYVTIDMPSTGSDAITRFRDDGTTVMRINPNAFSFQVDIAGAGRITSGSWSASDKKIKRQVEPIKNALQKIAQLNPKSYYFDNKNPQFAYLGLGEEEQFGLIAQELQQVFPNLVKETEEYNEDGVSRGFSLQAVNYPALIPVLIAGMQEQQQIIEDLETRLANLERLLGSTSVAPTTIGQSATKLSDAQLLQNQPNPFSDDTVIRYFVPEKTTQAALQITDAFGKIIKEIPIQTKGEGQTFVQANSLSAGTYFYTLILDGKSVDTKQMVLTK